MTREQLLDSLYLARRKVTRLIVLTARDPEQAEVLQRLNDQRERLVWQINIINLSELTASLAQIDQAEEVIARSTNELQALTATAANIDKTLTITGEILGVVAGLVTKL
jgi:hypothetical protein